ncbi:MAG: sulfatase-like hydrolase/transferase, partial [Lentisphaeraceae bacterium]|nr:sulfatase-like hydrolase/transferase [Lentisphaeraceae bacterium]
MKYLILLYLIAFSINAQEKRPNILIALADNWAFPTASAYGDKVVKTPTFDRIAKNGILFNEAYCQIPSCSPARAVLLSGQAFCRLGSGANLWGFWPEVKNYPDLLKESGYHVGYTIKGWGPGYFGNKPHKALNPAGKYYKQFAEFIDDNNGDKPFCFWFGSHDPHMPWNKGGEHKKGIDQSKIRVPKYLPDHPVVRQEIAEYYGEVQKFDYEVNEMYKLLEKKGMLENTILIMMGDNGWQAPRGLANLYDAGTKTCMAIQWPAKYKNGGKV